MMSGESMTQGAQDGRSVPLYRERMLPRWWVWGITTSLVSMVAIAYGAALGASAGWVVAAAGLALVTALIVITSPVLQITTEGIRVGRARLPRHAMGTAVALSPEDVRAARGPGCDARLFVALRPWHAATAVRVDVADPDDPHPAWLITTRDPERVLATVAATMVP